MTNDDAPRTRRVVGGRPARRDYTSLREAVYLIDPGESTMPAWARALGYSTMFLVWAAVLAVAVLVGFSVLPGMLGAASEEGLSTLRGFQGGNAVGGALLGFVVAAPLLGAIQFVLIAFSVGQSLSTATLVVRSLRRSYRDEALSMKVWIRPGEFPVGFYGLTVPLLPTRLTRWTKCLMTLQFFGVMLSVDAALVSLLLGEGYIWTVGWTLWPAPASAVPWCAALSIVLYALIPVVVALRRRSIVEIMPEELRRTIYGRSWPHRSSRQQPTASAETTGIDAGP